MIYPISTPGNGNLSSTRRQKINNQQRQRSWWNVNVSFSGIIVPASLIVVAALSLASVMMGMQYVMESPSSNKSSNHLKDVMVLPDNSISSDEDFSNDVDDGADDELADEETRSNDDQVSDEMSDGEDALPTPSESADQQLTEEDSDGDAGGVGQFSNVQKNGNAPSQSLRQRQTHYPRIISFNGEKKNWSTYLRRESENSNHHLIKVSKHALNEQKRLTDSDDWSFRDPLYEGDCVPMQSWQETSFPNCNQFHEFDFGGKSSTDEFAFWAKGGYNQIFWANEKDKPEDPELVIKVLIYGTEYTDRNFDRVRRDGLIVERLTDSPYVLDTYGFCGFDVLTPFADGGTLSSELRRWERGKIDLSPKTRLKYAFEVSAGLAAVHDIDGEGLSSVAHGDLKGGQYLFMDGVIQLGDFNRGRFLRRNSTAPETACTYTIGKNDAAFRSPEEYEYLPQTSAIDVYALGSILYELLTGNDVWHDTDTKKAQKYIRHGELPKIDKKILNSDDPVDLALREAIDMCYVFDPKKRATAGAVASFLQKRFEELP